MTIYFSTEPHSHKIGEMSFTVPEREGRGDKGVSMNEGKGERGKRKNTDKRAGGKM